MADTITLNLISSEKSSKTSPKKGIKHQQFLGRRRFLESKGYLNKKQNKYNNRQEHMSKAQRKQKKHKHQKPPRCFNANVIQSRSPATHNKDALSPPPNNKSSTHVPSFENVRSSLHTAATSTSSAALKSSGHTFSLTSCSTPIGNPTKYVAIDCEMVGAGPKGCISQLARCSIVSYDGDVMFDKFVKPNMPVTDYRSRWSGIRPKDLANATPYTEAKKEILKILQGKVVIGHAIHNDFKSLNYSHPTDLTRDTSRIPLLNLKAGFKDRECASLKRLTKAILNRDIQTGKKGHSSVEDAQATMELYKVVEQQWERSLASKS